MTTQLDPKRNIYMLVARMDGTRFHAATVRARRIADAHTAYDTACELNSMLPRGCSVLALDHLSSGFYNPSAVQLTA